MRIMRLIFVIIGLILISLTVEAQLFVKNEIYPNSRSIKCMYYNGTGAGNYWSLDYIDILGRVFKKESYHNKQLLSRQEIRYDDHNNKLFDIQSFDINNPGRIDTVRYEYKYMDGRIVFQCCKRSEIDSTVTELIKNEGDSIFTYQEKSYYFRQKTSKTAVFEKLYNSKFKNGLLISNEILDKRDNTRITISYEYFENGRLKRRFIKRNPETFLKGQYSGGPGSDDEYFKYILDPNGRILRYYMIIDGKEYKIAAFKYN